MKTTVECRMLTVTTIYSSGEFKSDNWWKTSFRKNILVIIKSIVVHKLYTILSSSINCVGS